MFLWGEKKVKRSSVTLLCNVTISGCSFHQQKLSKPGAIFGCTDLTVAQKVNHWRSETTHRSTSIISICQDAATQLEISHVIVILLDEHSKSPSLLL